MLMVNFCHVNRATKKWNFPKLFSQRLALFKMIVSFVGSLDIGSNLARYTDLSASNSAFNHSQRLNASQHLKV